MAASPPPSSDSVAVFQLRRRGFLVLVVVLIAPWVIVMGVLWQRPALHSTTTPDSPLAEPGVNPTPPEALVVSIGPWGQLETYGVLIEPPASLLNLASLPAFTPYWYFDTQDNNQIGTLLESAKLTPSQRAILLDRSRWRIKSDGIEVPTTPELIHALSPETRRTIYAELARFRGGNSQLITFGFRGEVDEWFARSQLSEATMAMVRPLIYRRGNALQFSDLPLIINEVTTMRERLALVRVLARTRTQMARVRLFPDSDRLSIAKYWSTGRDPSRIESLLNTVPMVEQGFPIDIIHLLPSFPRRLLYTYPQLLSPGQVAVRDCHWTSLNFSKPEIDDSLADMTEVQRQYQLRYYSTNEPPQFGDILLFVQADGTVLHSCVQLAGSLVFTKNGTSLANPWILMQLPDVLALYPSEGPVDIQVLRARD